MRMFMNVDIISSLRMIMSNNTLFYQTDFEYDVEIFQRAAAGSYFLWMSRKSGTYLFNEYDTHIRDISTPDEASIAIKHLIPVYILKPDNTSEKAQNTADVSNAVYSGHIFGMGRQEKRLLNNIKGGK